MAGAVDEREVLRERKRIRGRDIGGAVSSLDARRDARIHLVAG